MFDAFFLADRIPLEEDIIRRQPRDGNVFAVIIKLVITCKHTKAHKATRVMQSQLLCPKGLTRKGYVHLMLSRVWKEACDVPPPRQRSERTSLPSAFRSERSHSDVSVGTISIIAIKIRIGRNLSVNCVSIRGQSCLNESELSPGCEVISTLHSISLLSSPFLANL